MTTLVIAEKPSVGRDLARVLGARGRGEGVLEGPDLRVSWCVGHLLELADPERYDLAWKRWTEATLPMLPPAFVLSPRRDAGKQLAVLARLMKARDVTRIVNACDAGREGELIFRYVWQHVFGDRRGPPVMRLWIASLTDEAIRDGFARLRPGAAFEPLAAAARCRSEADWLVGLNATRAMTLAGRRGGGETPLLSVGRVQTPTLAMVTAREDAIAAFVPQPYWTVDAIFSTATNSSDTPSRYTGRWHPGKPGVETDRLTGPDAAERAAAIVAAVRGQAGQVVAVTRQEAREKAPPLFDLTSLQKLANQRFGMSADRTLKAAQALYEQHKAITYPRTDARFVTRDMADTLPGLVAAQRQTPWGPAAEAAMALGPRPHRKIVDDAEVSDHHAILPTTKIPDAGRLGPDERRVYELVARRFLAAFLPDAVFDVRTIATAVGPHVFHSKGRVRVVRGWHDAEPPPPPKKGDEEEAARELPDVRQGAAVKAVEAAAKRHETQPPKRHTEATLLAAMEHAGRELEEDELRRAMRDSGLGTPATRAAIIETLLGRDYLRRDGKSLVPTAVGRALIAALPVETLKSPALTGSWEARLARMARGEAGEAADAFMTEIRAFTSACVAAMAQVRGGLRLPAAPSTLANGRRARAADGDDTRDDARGVDGAVDSSGDGPDDPTVAASDPLGPCPLCGGAVVAGRGRYRCTATGCAFAIRDAIAHRKVSPRLVSVLLARRVTQPLKGFKAKSGRRFEAALRLGDDGQVTFAFESRGQRDERAADDADSTQPQPAPKAAAKTRAATGRTRGAGKPAAGEPPPAEPANDHPRELSPRPRCPRCREGLVMAGRQAWGCTRWREGCRFVVGFAYGGLALPQDEAERLFRKGETRLMAGLVSDGRARLILDADVDGGVRLARGKR